MFELFIALFGGVFFIAKYANDQAKSKESDLRIRSQQELRELLRRKYEASHELEESAKEHIRCGAHYDEICEEFAEDFRYVFGSDWKSKLNIPHGLFYMRNYRSKDYPWGMPSVHISWVYHLMLAKQGKIDWTIFGHGYPIGGVADKDMNIRFAECIENHLHAAGATEISLGLELDGSHTADFLCGGSIVIETLSSYPTHKLWRTK